ncbi:MAG TPA: hypothetical protein PKD45_00090 [Flavobacteriales bacterium]|nr:hypothetical protein [Flavobacteriales bacterium]
MRTLLPVLLLALLPVAVVAQGVSPQPQGPSEALETLRELGAPNVIARNCAFNSSEAIFNSDGRGSKDTVPQAQLKIASPDARASHPSRDDVRGIASRDDVNATTLAVLLANRPERFTENEWLRMMQEPVNRALFPLRVTPGMLDTLDGREMDLRFRYVMVGEW